MKPGELEYNGRKVKPDTFDARGKDLRRLIGRCGGCGRPLRGHAALPTIDSYASDLYDDKTPVVQCQACDEARAEDI
ncbi:MAG: hypothetical protein ABFC88_12535 [Thermoguttaceae bacterium]